MPQLFKNKTVSSAIALFTATVILTSVLLCAPIPVLSASSVEAYIAKDGEKVTSLMMEEDEKLFVEAVAHDFKPLGYRWQIKDGDSTDKWVDISGVYSKELPVSYALIGSMLSSDGSVALRCRMGAEDLKYVYTDPIVITVSFKAPAPYVTAPQIETFARPMLFASRAEEHTTHSIVINYLFDNNAIAFEPYGASVAAGSDFTASVPSPKIMGYAPFRRVGESYVDAAVVDIDIKNIQQDVTINVIYEPALVDFSIHHHLQNLLDDDYSLSADRITQSQAITGTVVGDGLALTEEQLPGFKSLAYEKLPVAADGSTVIEIRYDRNYYLVDFDMAGGYGTEPIYTRYGATVGANTPIRHGYVFDGWELVSYGGKEPTAEQKSKYDISDGKTILLPDANLRYKARWITQNTEYTMVFWKENANDNGYSYWGYLDGLVALSGSYVSGRDLIAQVPDIDDEAYFTFNEQRTDKNVIVEGDGSTVVNVYYTRNYYKLTFKAPAQCTIPVGHSHTDACYDVICGLGHTHNENCHPTLTCEIPEHLAHTEECIVCDIPEHIHGSADCTCNKIQHTHSKDCWNNVGNAATPSGNYPSNPADGQVYRYRSWFTTTYYIYIKGVWYVYTSQGATNNSIVDPSCDTDEHTHGNDCACNLKEHTHGNGCYKDMLHTHEDHCYTYSCGSIDHTHSDACYRLICGITTGHTHTSNCTSASKESVVKEVYRKYQQSIEDLWPLTDDNGVTYDSGERWKPSGSSYYNQVLVYLSKMVPENFTLTLDEASYTPYTMNYYLQVLDGDPYDTEYNKKYYDLSHSIKASYNYVTKAEDFFDISGFNQEASNPSFSNNQISISGNNKVVNFYYTRKTDHYLRFSNNGTVLNDRSVYGIMYGAPLSIYNFTPDYPDNLEPNAYSFAGWYTSPGCFEGTEVNWDTVTMTEGDLMLYAKWAPITHTVKVYKDATLSEQIGETQVVDHKAFAYAPADHVTNGNYVFQGWFYRDTDGTEKAFVFTGIPILEDMVIYAKWSSHVSVNYKIFYKLLKDGTEIAEPTVGSAIAGHNKTFDAKAGDQLYKEYQTGFYPQTNSHTITMSVDGVHEFTFYYVYVESMPYTVQYIDADTGDKLFPDKVVSDNTLSVVTETFVKYEGKMPDAYQKRLVLSASDSDSDGVYDQNTITFYYKSDDEHAYYRIVHYIQNISGDSYREYRSEEIVGVIGNTYTVSAINLTGFTFMGDKTVINGTSASANGDTVTATLGAEGMLVELYYDRNIVNYRVEYLNESRQPIIPDKESYGVFGQQVVEYAANLSGLGYLLASDNLKMLTLSVNEDLNVITFLYQERTVSVKYEMVGAAGCGSLSQSSENISAITGKPNGSQPIASEGFIFGGWFKDAQCTIPVEAEFVDPSTNKLSPDKAEGVIWADTTVYYAQFIALTTDLTVKVSSALERDDQVFIFNVAGKPDTDTAGVNLTITVKGNGSTTITDIPTGEYIVTELSDWCWRYEGKTETQSILLDTDKTKNTLTFDHERTEKFWLDGNAEKTNIFGKN